MLDILNEVQTNYITSLLAKKIDPQVIKNKYIQEIISKSKSNNLFDPDILDITSILRHNFSINDAKSDGITFTPIPIVKYMYKDVLSLPLEYVKNYKIADLSVGNGAFFVGLILLLKEKYPEMSIVDFIENNLYGYDVKKENIYFTKLNLFLLSLYFGENPQNIKFNLFNVDTLKHFINNQSNIVKFDLIVGNPPYVKQQNIPSSYRDFLIYNFETIKSNYNLYYAFIELSISLLNENGISLQLVPNYLLKIKSAQNLRSYLLENNNIQRIVNFNANKIFDGVGTYSMAVELSHQKNKILYKSLPNDTESLMYLENSDWKVLSPKNITQDSINLMDNKEERLVNQVQSQLYTLDISTGIATQKDKLYLVDKTDLIDNKYMVKIFNNNEYLIEKESVVKIFKGSGQRKGNLNYSYIIYPYTIQKNKAILKSIDYISKNEPNTYNYLLDAKEELCKRSGINSTDSNWYKYGRSQSLNRFQKKILFPTNSLEPNFNLVNDRALFFNGYAIYGLKEESLPNDGLKALEIILNSQLTKIFMLCTSYFISSGYVSYQKKYIEKFTIPFLKRDDIFRIIELEKSNNIELLNEYIFSLYNLDYYDFCQ